jgi:hypothetical protein
VITVQTKLARLKTQMTSLEAEATAWSDSKMHLLHPIEVVEVALTDLLLSATKMEGPDATMVAGDIRRTGEKLKQIKGLCM